MSKKAIPDFVEDASAPLHGARWRFDGFELDERRRELSRSGELILLEPKPLNLLMLLLRHPGQLVTKNDLIETLWAGRIVTEAVLGNCVTKLRAALAEPLASQLKTVHGYGYRFDVQAELIPDREAEAAPPKLQFEAGAVIAQRPNWQLVRRLGLSGDSWLAEHVKTRARRVFKFTNELQGLSALKREVTIYRLLRESLGDSARYVDILDWNFDAPPWFTESEYCAGGSLQEWFESQGGVANVPMLVRLDLIAQIADAIADIHAHGVLHKDLKPANVFVVPGADGAPTIRLADFGSGRLMDVDKLAALQITRMGFTQVIDTNPANTGTPLYLAPEVLDGFPPTLKADIYALGVMLYQCVVGNLRRPLATGWEQGIDDEMLRDDIAAAAEGNPERRLANAAEIARNLRSIEQRRIVRIAEREAQQKLERETRALERMRARRVGLIAAFVALAAGFAVSAYLYVDARKARVIAELETRRAEKVAAFLGEDMFQAVNTDDHPVKDLTVKQLLDNATNEVGKRFADEPDIAARMYETLGHSYIHLQYSNEASDCLTHALELREAQGERGTKDLTDLAEQLVGVDYPAGRLRDSLPRYQSILDASESLNGASNKSVQRLRVAVARGRIQLGEWNRARNELASVLQLLKLQPDQDVSLKATVERGLSVVEVNLGLFPEAEQHLYELRKDLVALRGNDHQDVAFSDLLLARVLTETGRLERAELLLNQTESTFQKWFRNDTGMPLTINIYRAWLRLKQNRPLEAIALLQDNKRLAIKEDQEFDQSFSENQPLALAYRNVKRMPEALDTIRSAYTSSQNTLGQHHPTTLAIGSDLVQILFENGLNAEAQSEAALMLEATKSALPDAEPSRRRLIPFRQSTSFK